MIKMTDIVVEVVSREQIEEYVPGEKEICISIRSHHPYHPSGSDSDRSINLSDKFVATLSLQFDDIDPDRFIEHRTPIWTPLTYQQAREISKFTKKHIHDATKLMIHCRHGISRSRSTAQAIVKYFGIPTEFQVYNEFVYKTVLKALND